MLQRRGRIYDCIRSQSSPRFGILVDRREESIYAVLGSAFALPGRVWRVCEPRDQPAMWPGARPALRSDLASDNKVVPYVEPKDGYGVERNEAPPVFRHVVQVRLDLSGFVAGGVAEPTAGDPVFHVAPPTESKRCLPSRGTLSPNPGAHHVVGRAHYRSATGCAPCSHDVPSLPSSPPPVSMIS